MVFRRHVLNVFLYILSFFQFFFYFFQRLIEFGVLNPTIYNTCNSFLDSLGVFLALTRLLEPFVWQEFKQSICSLLSCCSTKKINVKKERYSKDSLNSFINSAMNIEFVYFILLGIDMHIS